MMGIVPIHACHPLNKRVMKSTPDGCVTRSALQVVFVVQELAQPRSVPLQVGDVIADLLDRFDLLRQVVRLDEVLHLRIAVLVGKRVKIEESLQRAEAASEVGTSSTRTHDMFHKPPVITHGAQLVFNLKKKAALT